MKKWAVLALLSGAMFIIVIDTTMMNVSISALVADLNTTVSGIQSAISIYALIMASFILIGGKLADIVGKKRIFIIGLGIYAVGTTTASLSQSLGMLIIGWSVLEGLGAAMMLPNIQTLLRDSYEGQARSQAYGIIGAVGAIGAAVGPIVGGFLTTYASWRWAFRLELLVVIAILVFRKYLPTDKLAEKRIKFDFLGAGLNIVGWSSIVLGFLMIQTYGLWFAKQPFVVGNMEIAPFGLSIVPVVIGFGIIIILLLLSWERHLENGGGDGLFKPSLLKIEGLTSGFAVRFMEMCIFSAFIFTYPLLLQLSFEFSAIETGMALMPFSIALLISAMIAARLTAKYTAKRIIQVGFIISILGLLVIEFTIQSGFSASDLGSAILYGFGLGLILPQTLNLVLSLVSGKDTPETAGLNGTFEQLGNSVGVALVGTIMLVMLSGTLEKQINASPNIPDTDKPALVTAVNDGIELMSDTQVDAGLNAAGVSESTQLELKAIYADSRVIAFKAGIAFLLFVAIVGLILTTGLPNKLLVGEDEDEAGVVTAVIPSEAA